VRKTDGDNTNNTITLADTSGLGLTLAAGTTYSFEYYILFQSTQQNSGIALAINGPGTPTIISYTVSIPIAIDGTGAMFSGWGTTYNDFVLGTGVQTANTTYIARINGIVQTNAAGALLPRFRSETAGQTMTVKNGSWGALYPN
jgi:hypothetical protein